MSEESFNFYKMLGMIIMVALTTIITPIWLKAAYRKDPPEPSNTENAVVT